MLEQLERVFEVDQVAQPLADFACNDTDLISTTTWIQPGTLDFVLFLARERVDELASPVPYTVRDAGGSVTHRLMA